MASATADFGIDVFAKYKPIPLDPAKGKLTAEEKADLLSNISLLRDTIVYFTASGAARGVSGHTGGPYDTVPELCILEAFFQVWRPPDLSIFSTNQWHSTHRKSFFPLCMMRYGEIPVLNT
jgi:hypothetical protein